MSEHEEEILNNNQETFDKREIKEKKANSENKDKLMEKVQEENEDNISNN